MTKEEIVQVARRGREGEAEIRPVFEVAKTTTDRHMLAVCLDCFHAVLDDSRSDVAHEVVIYLGQLLGDRAYRGIWPRILRTLWWIGPAGHVIFPQLVATYLKRGRNSLRNAAANALFGVAWQTLNAGSPSEREKALEIYAQTKSHGLCNLRYYLSRNNPDPETRSKIEALISQLAMKYPKA